MFQFKNLLVTNFLMTFLFAAHSSEYDFDESCLECQQQLQRQPSKTMNRYDMNRPTFSYEVNQTVTYTPFGSNPNQPSASHKNPTPFRQQYSVSLQNDNLDLSCPECMRLYQQSFVDKNNIKQVPHADYERRSVASEINTNQSIYQGSSKRFNPCQPDTFSRLPQQNQFVPRAPLQKFEPNNRVPSLPPFSQTNNAIPLKKKEYDGSLLPPFQSIVPPHSRLCYEKEPPLPYLHPSPKNDPYDSLGIDSADEPTVQIQTELELSFPTESSKPKRKRWVVYEQTFFEEKQLAQLHKALNHNYDDEYIDEGARILESDDSTIYVRPPKRRRIKIEPSPPSRNEQQHSQPNVMRTSHIAQPPIACQIAPPIQEQDRRSMQHMTQNNHPPLYSRQPGPPDIPQKYSRHGEQPPKLAYIQPLQEQDRRSMQHMTQNNYPILNSVQPSPLTPHPNNHRQSFSEESTDQTLSAMTGSSADTITNDEPLLGEEFSWLGLGLPSNNNNFNQSIGSEYYDDLTELLQIKEDDYFG